MKIMFISHVHVGASFPGLHSAFVTLQCEKRVYRHVHVTVVVIFLHHAKKSCGVEPGNEAIHVS